MQQLDVCRRESGKIWARKPLPATDGRLLTITNSASSTLSVQSHNIRFLHAAFDITGDAFIAADHQGNVYLFDLHRNKFTRVQRLGAPCTALAFQLRRRSEFLAALSDFSLKCFDAESGELVATMKGHASVVQAISVHASGRYALTSAADTAQLWDLDTFQRKRKLSVRESVGIARVFFLPTSNSILTCFKDDSIFAWEADSLACKYQLVPAEGKQPGFKAFAASKDGRRLVAGGRSRYLHLWCLDTHKLLQIIELPKKITCMRQLEFLPDGLDPDCNQVLCVLAQDGILRSVSLSSYKQLFDVGSSSDRVANFFLSPNGRHLVTIKDSGDLDVYCVSSLCAELHKPPAPLVKILKSNKMADTTGSSAAASNVRGKARGKATPGGQLDLGEDPTLEAEMPGGLDPGRLQAILKGYGEYPAKYRMFIWRCLLRLPENHAAYGALVDKGTHSAFASLHTKFPIKSRKLLRVLQRVLSALAHWSPIFGETDFLPMLAFPFVKLFQNNQLLAFEMVATLLTNWCCHWFEYFPNPPINQLGMVENLLAHHDKALLAHFVRHNVTSQVYAWPVLETLFSEVLTRDEWLHLFDHVFSNPPAFLLVAAAAYCVTNRAPLLKCTELDDFKYFFHHRNAVDVSQVLKEAHRMMESTPEDIHPGTAVDDLCPLTKGQYPVFNKYPKFIVDYQIQEKERIRAEEEEYLRQRQTSLELQEETRRRIGEEEAWFRQQTLLLEAEERRRRLAAEEEQRLEEQRRRLAAVHRELRAKELALLEATRRRELGFCQRRKEAEIARLDDHIRRTASLRDTETQAAIDEAEARNMELQLQRKMLEQEMFREFAEGDQQMRSDFEIRHRQREAEAKVKVEQSRCHQAAETEERRLLQRSLAQADHMDEMAALDNRLEYRSRIEALEQERKLQQAARLTEENRRLQEELEQLTKEIDQRKRERAAEAAGELQQQRQEAERQRVERLETQVNDARLHLDRLHHTQGRMSDHLRDMEQSMRSDRSEETGQTLNESSSEVSTQFSLDRGRQTFEEREMQLMSEVRQLRQKLAAEGRSKRPPPACALD